MSIVRRLILQLHGTGVAHAFGLGQPPRILVAAQRLAALAQHDLVQSRAAAAGDGECLDESNVEMCRDADRLRTPVPRD
jgi:hypothetical protein